MAIAPSVNLVIEDEKGARSTMTVHVPTSFSVAEVLEAGEEVAGAVEALITGTIVQVQACIGVDFTPTQATPLAGSDVEEGAKMLFAINGGRGSQLRIPTFDESLFGANNVDVDTAANANALAFENLMEQGFTSPSTSNQVTFCDYREGDIQFLRSWNEDFTRSRKRR